MKRSGLFQWRQLNETKLLKYIILFAAVLLTLSAYVKAEVRIVTSGVAEASIIHGPSATTAEIRACQELQTAIEKITGVEIPINDTNKTFQIVVGTPASSTDIANNATTLGLQGGDEEKTAEYTIGNKLYLAGNRPRAASYAVYNFLENQLGVRWLWPGDDGEFMPQMSSIAADNLSHNQVPGFKYRGFHICGNRWDSDLQQWMLRNRMNIQRCPISLVSTLENIDFNIMYSGHYAKLSQDVFDSEPEVFALVDGQRIPDQLCFSNPRTVELMAAKVKQIWSANPGIQIINIIPADNQSYCQCSSCTSQGVSNAWFSFLKNVIDTIDQDPLYANRKYAGIAYQGYKSVPTIQQLPRLEFIEYCMYDECYRHGPLCSMNQAAFTNIAAWQATGLPVSIYGYEYDIFLDDTSVAQEKMIYDMTQEFKDLNIAGEISEVGAGWELENGPYSRRLAQYIQAKMLWDPTLSFTNLMNDWMTTVYGAAASDMLTFKYLQEEAWSRSTNHLTRYGHNLTEVVKDYLNEEDFYNLYGYLASARTAASGNQRILDEIDHEQDMLDVWSNAYIVWLDANGKYSYSIPQSTSRFLYLPEFSSDTEGTVYDSEVKMNYLFDSTRKYISIECTCYDPSINLLSPQCSTRDGNVLGDECIELIIATSQENQNGEYSHFAVNSLGTKYDAKFNATGENVSWDAFWTCDVEVDVNYWKLNITIPFEALGISAFPEENLSFAIFRRPGSRADHVKSGLPSEYYLGELRLEPANERLGAVVFNSDPTKTSNLSQIRYKSLQNNFSLNTATDIDELNRLIDNEEPLVIVVKCDGSVITTNYVATKLLPYASEQRASLVFYGSGNVNSTICGDATAPTGTGWDGDNRVIVMPSGEPEPWCSTPNDLTQELPAALAPGDAFDLPGDGSWEGLADRTMTSRGDATWLFRRPCGKGRVYFTSACMGFTGGASVLGSSSIDRVCKFIQNISAVQNTRLDVAVFNYDSAKASILAAMVQESLGLDMTLKTATDISELNELIDNEDPRVIVAKYDGSVITSNYVTTKLLPNAEKGSALIFYGSGNVNSVICGDATAPTWTGWDGDNRVIVMPSGDPMPWSSTPNDLNQELANALAPGDAYDLPSDASWEGLADRTMTSRDNATWLFRRPCEEGSVYFTSAGMGFSGGTSVFGSSRINRVCRFLQNISAARKSRLDVVVFNYDSAKASNLAAMVQESYGLSMTLKTATDTDTLSNIIDNRQPRVIVAKYDGSVITSNYVTTKLLPYAEQGATLVFYGSGNVNSVICGSATAPTWTGWDGDNRIIVMPSGNPKLWSSIPNDLNQQLASALAPGDAYDLPGDGSWEGLADRMMTGRGDATWLFRRPHGQGWVYFTSAGMGFAGGTSVLGSSRINRVCKFIQNLSAVQK